MSMRQEIYGLNSAKTVCFCWEVLHNDGNRSAIPTGTVIHCLISLSCRLPNGEEQNEFRFNVQIFLQRKRPEGLLS